MIDIKSTFIFPPILQFVMDQPGPSKPKDASQMTLAEYLSLPENQGANLGLYSALTFFNWLIKSNFTFQ